MSYCALVVRGSGGQWPGGESPLTASSSSWLWGSIVLLSVEGPRLPCREGEHRPARGSRFSGQSMSGLFLGQPPPSESLRPQWFVLMVVGFTGMNEEELCPSQSCPKMEESAFGGSEFPVLTSHWQCASKGRRTPWDRWTRASLGSLPAQTSREPDV